MTLAHINLRVNFFTASVSFIFFSVIYFFLFISSVLASSVLINEFVAHPSSGSDWVEIYNPTESEVNLVGFILEDSTSTIKEFAEKIPPKFYISFDVSNRLNNSGDTITLKDNSGNILDSTSYNKDQGGDISVGRFPDGGDWSTLSSPTKGFTNSPISNTTPVNTPAPTSTPQTASTSQNKSSSKFAIQSSKDMISSDQVLIANLEISLPKNPDTKIFLKGVFYKEGSTNYFGFTKVGDQWIKNSASYSNQFEITTDPSGNWSGSLEVKVDPADNGYKQSGNYQFKVGRYTQSGSGPTWSNSINIAIEHTAEENTSGSNNNKEANSSQPELIDSSSNNIADSSLVKIPSNLLAENIKQASVAGSALEQDDKKAKSFQINWFYLGSGLGVLLLSLATLVIFIKKRENFSL